MQVATHIGPFAYSHVMIRGALRRLNRQLQPSANRSERLFYQHVLLYYVNCVCAISSTLNCLKVWRQEPLLVLAAAAKVPALAFHF